MRGISHARRKAVVNSAKVDQRSSDREEAIGRAEQRSTDSSQLMPIVADRGLNLLKGSGAIGQRADP